jgi:hypothetical protein
MKELEVVKKGAMEFKTTQSASRMLKIENQEV